MSDQLYKQLTTYFDDIQVTKVKDTDTHSLYVAKIASLLANVQRYIMVFVPRDVFFNGHRTPLHKLRWTSLHTRSLQVKYDVPTSSYRPKQVPPHIEPIHMTQRETFKTVYKCKHLPLRVTLLHEEDDMFEYSNEGNLSAAIETYNTIIELI